MHVAVVVCGFVFSSQPNDPGAGSYAGATDDAVIDVDDANTNTGSGAQVTHDKGRRGKDPTREYAAAAALDWAAEMLLTDLELSFLPRWLRHSAEASADFLRWHNENSSARHQGELSHLFLEVAFAMGKTC